MSHSIIIFFFFFFNDTATTEIYTLSLHDALPISWASTCEHFTSKITACPGPMRSEEHTLNSSHPSISYAVFCLKKKKTNNTNASTKPKTTAGFTTFLELQVT